MSNLPANISDTINAMDTLTKTMTQNTGDVSYLKMLKSGEWLFGADDIDVAKDDEWVVNTQSFVAGFQAWENNELLGEEVRLITEPPITTGDLEDFGHPSPWKPLLGFELVCVSGTNEGTRCLYKTTSRGGIGAINDFMKKIVAKVKEDPTGDNVPLIKLAVSHYQHKKYGRIYTPEIKVLDWIENNPDALAAPEPEPEPDVEPEPEPTVEPTRRRRRRV